MQINRFIILYSLLRAGNTGKNAIQFKNRIHYQQYYALRLTVSQASLT